MKREQIGEVVTTIPTIGFNVESVTYKNLNFNVWVSKLSTSLLHHSDGFRISADKHPYGRTGDVTTPTQQP